MEKLEFNANEKELAAMNLSDLQTHAENAKAAIATAKSVGDVKTAICTFWSKYGKYIKALEVVPFAGKVITALAALLDSICAN